MPGQRHIDKHFSLTIFTFVLQGTKYPEVQNQVQNQTLRKFVCFIRLLANCLYAKVGYVQKKLEILHENRLSAKKKFQFFLEILASSKSTSMFHIL